MATIQLTQVYLAGVVPNQQPPELFIEEGSESPIAINPASIAAVGPVYQPKDGSIINIRQVHISGIMGSFFVTDSYATVKAYMDAV